MADTAVNLAPAPESKPPKLLVEDLSVTYLSRGGDPVPAVKDVTFNILDKPGVGEIVVFLGPSGCGKSTILKCLAGLLEPTKGRMAIDGQGIAGTSRDRGMVFQAYTSFAWMSVRDNVEYGMKLAGVDAKEREARAMEALTQVGLAEYARRYPKELSGGQKQRVAIARTLVNKPRLLLMDEPFGALDPNTRWGMQSLILDISRKVDNTILFVTHDVSEAVYVADTVFVLSARPAQILHRVDVPVFTERDLALKQTQKFREVEGQLLEMLHGQHGNVRVG
jgi:ABC-type nitrate/sulfonate/bicarbonate transport system ATPase subunit